MDWSILQFALAGAIGSLIKDILKDNRLKLPAFQKGEFYLGFFGGTLVGAFVGFLVDTDFLTSLLAGFMGASLIPQLLKDNQTLTILSPKKETLPAKTTGNSSTTQ